MTMKRSSEHLAWADYSIIKANQTGDVRVEAKGIPYTWKWDDETREVAEYMAVFNWALKHLDYEWLSILSWGSTAAIKGKDNG
jgi:hypothetical protein